MTEKTKRNMRRFKAILKKSLQEPEKYFMQVELLETHINLYYQAKEDISKNGISYFNKYGVQQKNPSVTILQQSSKFIQNILKELMITPTDEDIESNADDFIMNLISE